MSPVSKASARILFAVVSVCLATLICLSGCNDQPAKKSASPDVSASNSSENSTPATSGPFVPRTLAESEAERIGEVIECEKRILDLAPFVSRVGNFLTGKFTDRGEVEKIFTENVEYVPLESTTLDELLSAPNDPHGHRALKHAHWPLGDKSEIAKVDFLDQLWKPLRDGQTFSDCQFGVESGRFDSSEKRFEMKFIFEGRIRDDAGQPKTGVKARQTIEWIQLDGIWYVQRWQQESFDIVQASEPLFKDVTQKAVPDADTLAAVQRSSHEELMLDRIKKGNIMWPVDEDFPWFDDWESGYQFPAVSIVDFDSDGDDDVFLSDRFAKGLMLRNEGNGTFVDVTETVAPEVPTRINCSFFADFDNDGDADLLVGRSLGDSMYFINDNGKYRHDKSTDSELEYARFVVSGCVFDINNDGLLDVYLSTYVILGDVSKMTWVNEHIRPKDRLRVKLAGKKHPYVDRGGPGNIVLMNDGGKLKRVEVGNELAQWRNTYQSTTADWDNDGDQDLYLCNDFSPDMFLRNDTPQGEMKPKFTIVNDTVLKNGKMGFGMGSSWGDFDSDGDLDLYVSNMYSKAGKRIIKLVGEVDPRSVASSRGNFLFKNDEGSFTQIAGFDDRDQHVAKVGWSFGGQFADFDNDGNLDLYVPSGFFTAPEKVRSDEDL